jgi:hypothetical protein
VKDVMDVISTAYFIKCSGLAYHQFHHFLEETEANYGDVYGLAATWFSRDGVLKIFFPSRSEIHIFIIERVKLCQSY